MFNLTVNTGESSVCGKEFLMAREVTVHKDSETEEIEQNNIKA
jgi:hypothetical protein